MDDDRRPAGPPDDRSKQLFERLADVAEQIARTAAAAARIHDQMADVLPGVAEHAARERRLAAAEIHAARAYRNLEVPADTVRQMIRDSRVGRTHETRSPDAHSVDARPDTAD